MLINQKQRNKQTNKYFYLENKSSFQTIKTTKNLSPQSENITLHTIIHFKPINWLQINVITLLITSKQKKIKLPKKI